VRLKEEESILPHGAIRHNCVILTLRQHSLIELEILIAGGCDHVEVHAENNEEGGEQRKVDPIPE
jgi:hypothetical protein